MGSKCASIITLTLSAKPSVIFGDLLTCASDTEVSLGKSCIFCNCVMKAGRKKTIARNN